MTNQTAYSYLMSKFTGIYNGLPSVKFDNAAEFNNFISGLKRHRIPHQTKIVKKKPSGRIFVVMRLGGSPDGD